MMGGAAITPIGAKAFDAAMSFKAGGKGGALSFGKSKARLLGEDQIKINFSDVAGVCPIPSILNITTVNGEFR